jgi:GntR family transcriptional regulator
MLIAIDAKDSRPIYVQIIDEVRRAIVMGTLGPDDPLPSVRQLAGDLRVNPMTVSQAYRELERQGAVEVRRGQGTYVTRSTSSRAHRDALVSQVAQRALRDAHRNGLSADELIRALRSAANSNADKDAR